MSKWPHENRPSIYHYFTDHQHRNLEGGEGQVQSYQRWKGDLVQCTASKESYGWLFPCLLCHSPGWLWYWIIFVIVIIIKRIINECVRIMVFSIPSWPSRVIFSRLASQSGHCMGGHVWGLRACSLVLLLLENTLLVSKPRHVHCYRHDYSTSGWQYTNSMIFRSKNPDRRVIVNLLSPYNANLPELIKL